MTATKSKGKLYKVKSTPQLTKPMRLVKMLQPFCEEHLPGSYQSKADPTHPNAGVLSSPDGSVHPRSGWTKGCLEAGHDPFVTKYTVLLKKPTYQEQEIDGELVNVKTGETEYEVLRERLNIEQVPFDLKAYSAQGIRDAIELGWVFPEERGYAPYCEFRNCFVQNPKFRTPVGTYCNRDQAAVMVLYMGGDMRSNEGVPMYVPVDEDANRFRKQLAAVNIQTGDSGHEH
jgi:hypothetical protein